MAFYFVKNTTQPVSSVDGAGILVEVGSPTVENAVVAYVTLGHPNAPNDVYRVIPTVSINYAKATATFTYPGAPAGDIPPLPTPGT